MEQPKVIFLDAVGTLFGVRGSIGKIYAELASQFGVEVTAEQVNPAFYASFKASPPPVDRQVHFIEIIDVEYEWWYAIASATFQQLGILDRFEDFPAFFSQLYQHFASAAPWYVYPDVLPALEYWRGKGIELGVVSNFDSRLYQVLKTLKLADFFRSVTISFAVGAAKPNPKIFTTALAKHQCSPAQAWHIGDSLKEDYHGAKAVGMKAFLVERPTFVLRG
ncbi:MAG: HAD-IA family hydrolase [Kamptonema sp. SIO1D9]|nr:HAD-IA family hydrolase [Kamptonema sp. SIO1D9]